MDLKRLIDEIDTTADSLRFCFLGSHWTHRVEYIGIKEGSRFANTLH